MTKFLKCLLHVVQLAAAVMGWLRYESHVVVHFDLSQEQRQLPLYRHS